MSGGSDAGAVEAEASRLQDVRARLEAGVLPRATSLDGRTFTFEAPVDLPLQTGGYARLATPAGPLLGQVLERELVRNQGPEVAATSSAGVGYRTRVAYSSTAGGGVVLGAGGPFHDAAVAVADPADVAAQLAATAPPRARLPIGESLFAPGVPVELDAGGFARHTFLCGQSGSGKSYALGVLIEQLLLRTGLRIVVLDPNSDFVRLASVREGADPAAAEAWRGIAPGIGPRSLRGEGAGRLRLRFFDLDPATMAAVVRLDPLRDREEYGAFLELVEEEGRGLPLDAMRRRLSEGDAQERRLGDRIRNLGVLDWDVWSGDRGDPGLLGELDRRDWRCLVVDLGSVDRPGERAMVSAAVLGRLWGRRTAREPVLVVVDEAHNVCPAEPGDPLTAIATDLAVRIAAEGRKYGIHLLACTQRPQKVHENVVSQCDNLMLMRMNSPADVARLAELLSYAPPGLLGRCGVLRQGEALVAGRIAPHPLFLRVGARVAEEGGGDVPATWAAPA